MTDASVDALIQAAGRGERLGGQPKAFVALGDETVLGRIVRVMLEVAGRVIAAVPPDEVGRARDLVDDERVEIIAGGARRTDTTRLLVERASASWLILQDAAHPFVDAALSRRVLAAARTHGASVASLPVAEYVHDLDGRQRALPGELVTSQKPVACRREDLVRALELLARSEVDPHARELSSMGLLALAGVTTRFIPGDPLNIKLTYPEDIELARLLVAARERRRTA